LHGVKRNIRIGYQFRGNGCTDEGPPSDTVRYSPVGGRPRTGRVRSRHVVDEVLSDSCFTLKEQQCAHFQIIIICFALPPRPTHHLSTPGRYIINLLRRYHVANNLPIQRQPLLMLPVIADTKYKERTMGDATMSIQSTIKYKNRRANQGAPSTGDHVQMQPICNRAPKKSTLH
jgi:hypothetical protein